MLREKLCLLGYCFLLFLLSAVIGRLDASLNHSSEKRGLSAPRTLRAAKRLERASSHFYRIERRVIPLFLRLYAARRQ